jgi:hypothetical protein
VWALGWAVSTSKESKELNSTQDLSIVTARDSYYRCPSVRFSIARIFMIFTPQKSLREDDFGVKIKKKFTKYLGVPLGPRNSLRVCSVSLILRNAVPSKHAEHMHMQELMRTLSIRVRN